MRINYAPLPGLLNCLAAPLSPTHVSALTASGQILLPYNHNLSSSQAGPDAPATQPLQLHPATAHACTPSHIFVHVHDNFVYLTSISPSWQFKIPSRLHFQVRYVTVADHSDNLLVIVGGFDGAYFTYVPIHHRQLFPSSSFAHFYPLPGTEGYPVVHVAIADDAIAVVLLDSRVAIWSTVTQLAVTILNTLPNVAQGDRITDATFTPSGLLLAYWGGAIAYYTRVGAKAQLKFVIDTHASKTEHVFYKRGATLISYSPLVNDIALCVTGDGVLLFFSLHDAIVVKKVLRVNDRPASVKGLCDVNDLLFVWIVGVPDLVTVTWPASQQFSEARLALQLKREKEAAAFKKNRKRKDVQLDDSGTPDDDEADGNDNEQDRHDGNGRHNLPRNDYYPVVDDDARVDTQPDNSLKHTP